MAMSNRGRTGTRGTSTNFGSYSGYLAGTGSGGWGKTATSGTKAKRSAASGSAPAYKSVCTSFQNKINSYKTLMGQTTGPAKYTRPKPATLNTFANWINKGAIIQTVSCAQVARWAKTKNKTFNTTNPSPTACKNVLAAKFGKTTIKAVTRTKTGSFMVATASTWKGRSFSFPR